MLKVHGKNMELLPRAQCLTGAALSCQQHSHSRQRELCKAVFAEHPWSTLVHPEKVSAYMRAWALHQLLQYTEFITTQTSESCPKHSVLHGMGLPANTDSDIAEVKAKKAREVELAVTGNCIYERGSWNTWLSLLVVRVSPKCKAPYSSDRESFVCFISTSRGHKYF